MVKSPSADRTAATQLRGYLEAALLVFAATLVGLAIAPRWGNSAVDLLYLPIVLAAALLASRGAALFAAFASTLAYNYFFTAPRLTFRVDSPNDLVTVIVLFGAALVTSQLTASVRRQARISQMHADRSASIAGLARQLLSCKTVQEVADTGTHELASLFECNVVLAVGLPEPRVRSASTAGLALTPSDIAAAALALDGGIRTGRGVDRGVPTEWQFHPVRSGNAVIAAMGLARDDGAPAVARDQLPLLDNLLDQIALALERGRLESEAREFALTRDRDQLRSALLASIGHDIAPPLAVIAMAASELRRSGAGDKEQLATIGGEVARLQRHLANLADLTPSSDQLPVQTGNVVIDLFRRVVLRDGDEVHLTPKEFAVLAELAKQPGRVLSHAHLLRTAWGPAQENQTDYLRVAIRGLRQKLEDDAAHPQLILNEPAVGYRLKA